MVRYLQLLLLALVLPVFIYAQEPRLILPVGHVNFLHYATFSPDGKKVLTASGDKTAKIWDASSGRLLLDLSHNGIVNYATMSPDGKKVITGSEDSIAKLWDADNGNLLRVLYHNGGINYVAFSPDGKKIVTVSNDSTIKTWDLEIGILLNNYNAGGVLGKASFSSDGSKIITTLMDTALIFDSNSGELLSKIIGASFFASFLPNSTKFISGSYGPVKIWDSNNLKITKSIGTGDEYIYQGALSLDGKKIVRWSDRDAEIRDVNSGELINIIRGIARFPSQIQSIEFSPDGEKIITSSSENCVAKIWEVKTGKLLKDICGHSKIITSAQFLPDNNKIITMPTNSYIQIWDITKGELIETTPNYISDSFFCTLSSVGEKFIIGSAHYIAKMYNIHTTKLLHKFRPAMSSSFSIDGKKMLTYDDKGGYIKVWNVNSGLLLTKIKIYLKWSAYNSSFSPDGKKIITTQTSSGNYINVWDASNGKLLRKIKIGFAHEIVETVRFSFDETKILTTSALDDSTKIWDSKTGKLLFTFHGKCLGISPVGNKIAAASFDGTIKIWDISTGKLLGELINHKSFINSVSFSSDATKIVTTSDDHNLKIWDANKYKLLYSLIVIDSTDYLVVDSLGHYDGTSYARNLINYVCGNEIIDLDQIKELSWEPGLVSKIMGINKEPITAKGVKEINICNQVPEVEDLGLEKDIYRFKITPHEGGIGEIQLFINNHLRINFQKQDLKKEGENFILEISKNDIEKFFIPGSENYISAKATVSNGKMVSKGPIIVESGKENAKPNPNMYLLSIGVSQYKGEKIRLNYAANDAINFSSALTDASSKLLETDGKKHVYTFNCTTSSTNPGYWPTKSSIQNILKTISDSSKAEDIVVIFYSGHGSVKQGDNNFYFLTSEATSFDDLISKSDEVAISSKELNKWLQIISADKVIMIIDACNSGQLVKELDKFVGGKKEVPADQQRALENLKDHSGTYILSACSSDKSAFETNLYSQGVLTYSLLSSIKLGEGLRDKKFIDVSKWFDVTSKTVEKISKEIGRRQDPQIYGNASIDVGMVDSVILDKIYLPKRGIVFNRSSIIKDGPLHKDNLEISVLVDKELKEVTSKGGEAPLLYIPDNTCTESYVISGNYSIDDNTVKLSIYLTKGLEDKIIYQFNEITKLNEKETIGKNVVKKIKDYLSKNKPE